MFPTPGERIIEYITHACNVNVSYNTIVSRLSAVSYIHKLANFTDPIQQFAIQKMLVGAKKLLAAPDMRLPITREILDRLVEAAGHTTQAKYYDLLIKSMFTLAFYAFLRVGEMTAVTPDSSHAIRIQDIHISNGPSGTTLQVTMHSFKHSGGSPSTLQIFPQPGRSCPIAFITKYLQIRGPSPGPLYIFPNGRPVSRFFFIQQLQAALVWCNLDTRYYKGHSFRIGAATTAAELGLSDSQIASMGRWKSSAYKRYIRIPMLNSLR